MTSVTTRRNPDPSRAGVTAAFLILLTLGLAAAVDALAAGNAPNRLELILKNKLVQICIWPDYYGITYRNPKTQELSGIDIDMALQLGKDLGVAVQFVDSSFARLIDDITLGHCDVAMFAVGITPARAEKLRFTRPHLASDIYAITTRTNLRIKNWEDIDKPGVVVAVAKGTVHEPIMKEKLKEAELIVLDSPFAREQEVQSGRADVFITDYPYSQRFLANADWARLIAPPQTYHITPYAYAVAPGDDPWYARMERFVDDIKRDGRLLASAKRHRLEPILAR